MRNTLTLGLCATLCCALAAPASAETLEQDELEQLSIEELANIQVRSASKRDEPLSSAPASLYVITGDDIVLSGVTSLPEALRLAPNLIVQQVDASDYTISARGFTGTESANKMLVLIDGRTVYTPLASSVFWNLHSPMLEDIQQVEVISGPGGTLYGPNAVNGVINVTSRSALDTIGTLARGTAGAYERTAALRHGIAIGEGGALRVYGNWHDREDLPTRVPFEADDAYRGWQAGFRSDFASEADTVTFQGDVFRNRSDVVEGDGNKGFNLLGRWSRAVSAITSFQLKAYYDDFKRETLLVDDSLQTMDAEAQLNTKAGAHELVVGVGVRTTRDEFINDLNFFQLDPRSERLWTYNAFVQDNFSLTPDLSLIAGVKVERSSFTGWQVLPNVRLAWDPGPGTLLWAAVSRAVRTPSRIDRQLTAGTFLAASTGFDSEKLWAVEAGYRGQPSRNLSLSVTGFVNFYDDLRTTEFTGDPFPIRLQNNAKGKSYGVEAWGHAQLTPWWRASLGGFLLEKDFEVKEGRTDLAALTSTGSDPSWQLIASSDFDIAPRLHLTLNARAVDGLDLTPQIDSYAEAGGRLAYYLTDELELFVAGRNLLHKTHAENGDPDQSQLARRSIYGGARVRF